MKKDKRIEIRISSDLLERLKLCMANDKESQGLTIADLIRNEIKGYCEMIEDENKVYVQKENVRTENTETVRTNKESVRTNKKELIRKPKDLPNKYKGIRLPANW